jgi:uncharacterized protein (TIGR02678 family)
MSDIGERPTGLHELVDRRAAARHLLSDPLTCAEHHPEMFTLIRRHEQALDRWFTQRLGYRVHVSADTARLYKSTAVPHQRGLRTATNDPRLFTRQEYVQLALALAAVAAGPRVISLRDLVEEIRSAAGDAGVVLTDEPSERRALVTALYWMIDHGLAREVHERVERYATDESADAVLEIVPDRVALVPLSHLGLAESADDVVHRDEPVTASRQWMRARLVEDPVLYHDDLTEEQWREIRRRLGNEAEILHEMFGLVLEARAEGMAAIDPAGELTDLRFPATGTRGHAALLLAARLAELGRETVTRDEVVAILEELAAAHGRHWSKEADNPARLADRVLRLLADHRLVELDDGEAGAVAGIGAGAGGRSTVRVLPLVHRFAPAVVMAGNGERAVAGTGPGPVAGGSGSAPAGQEQLF